MNINKRDFICPNCKQVVNKSTKRYECPKHGHLCKNCVETFWIKSAVCKQCDSKVLTFNWSKEKSKWL
ncbi:hypothetical protein [Aliarcobacter cryaerophilus]|uniref:hypothetical protein n=1 Tax=Aliarcobacter cryaerophilus TaxID=28198 RepID=UPI0021B38286|nr:hypothetical protein [Aliarcobacter cryaerophilus]MCT7512798.1 hypothetical protein [Aliarcobacter cryaerophilus]MCT7523212.1 hypothetical protein [Aliarcobacter cryaerophilus]